MRRVLCLSIILAAAFAVVATGCVGPPKGIEAVRPFEVHRYLGTWYEVARLDHSFERGLTDVTATYARGEDGTVRVTNRGYDPPEKGVAEHRGVGKPAGDANVGSLKVKVGAPFFAGYHVIALDQDAYAYSMVCGPTRDYLWVLSRTPSLPEEVLMRLVGEAESLGFKTDQLIYVTHDRNAGVP